MFCIYGRHFCIFCLSAFNASVFKFHQKRTRDALALHGIPKLKMLRTQNCDRFQSIQIVLELAGRLVATLVDCNTDANGNDKTFDIWYHFYVSHISVRNGESNKISGNAKQYENYYTYRSELVYTSCTHLCFYLTRCTCVCVCV